MQRLSILTRLGYPNSTTTHIYEHITDRDGYVNTFNIYCFVYLIKQLLNILPTTNQLKKNIR